MKPRLYIDRLGSRPIEPTIPNGARIAVHIPGRDCLELHVEANGAWALKIGPGVGQSGEFRTIESGHLFAFEDVRS